MSLPRYIQQVVQNKNIYALYSYRKEFTRENVNTLIDGKPLFYRVLELHLNAVNDGTQRSKVNVILEKMLALNVEVTPSCKELIKQCSPTWFSYTLKTKLIGQNNQPGRLPLQSTSPQRQHPFATANGGYVSSPSLMLRQTQAKKEDLHDENLEAAQSLLELSKRSRIN